MNAKERDRSGDGAAPVALVRKIKTCCLRVSGIIMPLFLLCTTVSYAQQPNNSSLQGLSLTVDIGAFKPSNNQANFYNGAPSNVNNLNRIIHSEAYGHSIWNNLTEQDLIGSSVASYSQITVAEYGQASYKIAFQLGMGLRYDLSNPYWAWHLRFDYAKLQAQGLVLLNSGHNSAYLTNQNAYVNCPYSGLEERIYIDLGMIRKLPLSNGLDVELAFGANVNNTKVQRSDIRIAGVDYSILDIWDGETPSAYSPGYEYVNQGGLGVGGWLQANVGFTIPAGTAMMLGYTFYYNKVTLEGYSGYSPHHAIKLSVYVNNFSLF